MVYFGSFSKFSTVFPKTGCKNYRKFHSVFCAVFRLENLQPRNDKLPYQYVPTTTARNDVLYFSVPIYYYIKSHKHEKPLRHIVIIRGTATRYGNYRRTLVVRAGVRARRRRGEKNSANTPGKRVKRLPPSCRDPAARGVSMPARPHREIG